MATIINPLQLHQDPSQTQQRLTNNKTKKDLTLYEKNSMNKVNFRSFLGKNYICSTQDKYKKIRIPIISLFLKLLSSSTPQNLQRINTIKTLIYSQKLQEIVKKHGITAEELLTNFAFAFRELEIGSEKVESQFIKKINSEPFFDKIIMESFYQVFYTPRQERTLTANISKWIKQQLKISIVFVQNQNETQTDSHIFLKKNQNNQILRILRSFNICSMTSIFDEQSQAQTPLKQANVQRQSERGKFTQSLLKSISSCESPTRRYSSNRKPNDQYVAVSMQNSIEAINNKENNFSQEKSEPETTSEHIKVRKTQTQKSSESKFWKILCCNAD